MKYVWPLTIANWVCCAKVLSSMLAFHPTKPECWPATVDWSPRLPGLQMKYGGIACGGGGGTGPCVTVGSNVHRFYAEANDAAMMQTANTTSPKLSFARNRLFLVVFID